MNEEKNEEIINGLLEVSNILHVLQIALANIDQPCSDTSPYAFMVGKVENKLSEIVEKFG